MEDFVLPVGDKFFNQITEDFYKERKILFNYNVDETCIESVLAWLMKWEIEDLGKPVEDRKKITIFANSGGGYVDIGLTLIDFIQNMKTPINIVVLSMAYSMMGIMLLSVPVERRFAFKHSSILLHDGTSGAQTSSSKMKDIMSFLGKTEERCKDIVLNNTTISKQLYKKNYEKEWFMYAEEAKSHGIIGSIIGEDCKLEDIL